MTYTQDIVDALYEDAVDHDAAATCCDCAPEQTVNYRHAVNARRAAKEIERLRAELGR